MSHRQRVKQLLSDRNPLVVGAISDPGALDDTHPECDVIELRLDSLGVTPAVRQFAESSRLPVLVTARGPAEGGQGDLTVAQRAEAYRALLPSAALIDIELRDFDALEPVIAAARESGTIVVGSFHDFEKTPPPEELEAKKDPRADLHKFALMAHSTGDIRAHLALAEALGDLPFSLMGMGPLGAAARPLMARAGSLLNYGYLGGRPTAPDQWPAALLGQTLKI